MLIFFLLIPLQFCQIQVTLQNLAQQINLRMKIFRFRLFNPSSAPENGIDKEWMEKVKSMQERRMKMKEEYEQKVKSSQQNTSANVVSVTSKPPAKSSTFTHNPTRSTPSKIGASQSFIVPSKTVCLCNKYTHPQSQTSATLKPVKSQFNITSSPVTSRAMSPNIPTASSQRSQAATPAPHASNSSSFLAASERPPRPVNTSRIIRAEASNASADSVYYIYITSNPVDLWNHLQSMWKN